MPDWQQGVKEQRVKADGSWQLEQEPIDKQTPRTTADQDSSPG